MTELIETEQEQEVQVLREKLILAHKILLAAGVLQQNLGHASIRLPGEDRILIMGHLHDVGKTFENARTDDLSIMDLDGNPIGGALEPPRRAVQPLQHLQGSARNQRHRPLSSHHLHSLHHCEPRHHSRRPVRRMLPSEGPGLSEIHSGGNAGDRR